MSTTYTTLIEPAALAPAGQVQRAHEGLLDRDLLVEREADEERHRV